MYQNGDETMSLTLCSKIFLTTISLVAVAFADPHHRHRGHDRDRDGIPDRFERDRRLPPIIVEERVIRPRRDVIVIEKPAPTYAQPIYESPKKSSGGCDADVQVYEYSSPKVNFVDPKLRPAKSGQNSAAYVTMENKSDLPLKVVSATSSVADVVELHTSYEDRGVMKMRPIDEIDMQAGESVNLKPGGLHIMLIGLKKTLRLGQKVTININFDNGKSVRGIFEVKKCCGSCHNE